MTSHAGLWVDRAIDVAVQMVVGGDDRREVIEVAALSHGTSQADALGPVTKLLTANGIRLVSPTAGEAERFALLAEAFAHGGLSVEEFEGPWYVQLPAHDAQSETQRRVTQLLDERDHESDPAKTALITNEIRDVLVG
jgi:hypothetical protein